MKNESEIRNQMNGNLEALDRTSDCGVSNDNLIRNIREADLTVQPVDENPKMDAVSSEKLSDGKADEERRKRSERNDKKATIKDEVQSIDQTKMGEGSIQNLAKGNAAKKRKKWRKRKKPEVIHARFDQNKVDQTKMGEGSVQNLVEGNSAKKRKSKKVKVIYVVQSFDQNKMDTGSTENPAEVNVTSEKLKIKNEVHSTGQTKMDTRSTANLAEGNVTIKKPKSKDEVGSVDQTRVRTGSTEKLAEGNVAVKNQKIQNEVQSMDHTKTGMVPTENSADANVTRKRKKKRKSKAKMKDEAQREMDTRSTENIAEGNEAIEKPKIKDEVQSTGQIKMDTESTENLAEGNVTTKNPKIQDEARRMDQTKMETGPTENSAKGDVTRKRKRKRKRRAKIKDEVHSNIDTRSTENLAQGNVTIEIPKIKDEVQSIGHTKMDTGPKKILAEGNVTVENPRVQDEVESMDQKRMDLGPVEREMDTRPTENLAAGNVSIEEPKIKHEPPSFEQTKINTRSTENIAEANVTIENPKIQDEAQSMDRTKTDMEPTENSVEGNMTGKRKWNRKRGKKAKVKDEVPSKMDTGSIKNLAEGNVTIKKPEIDDEVRSVGVTEMDTENLAKGNVTIKDSKLKDEVQSMDKTEMDTGPTEDFAKENVTGKRKSGKKAKTEGELKGMIQGGSTSNLNCECSIDGKLGGDCVNNGGAFAGPMELERKLFPCESQHICHPNLPAGQKGEPDNGLTEVCNEIILDKGKDYAEGSDAFSTCNVSVTPNLLSLNEKDVEGLYPKTAPVASIKRKLLVLDINGLLADIVFRAPKRFSAAADLNIYGKAVFKRPFCDDFLKFCLQNFDVGIWSSKSKDVIKKVVSYLLGDQKDNLLFCWEKKHGTTTGFKTLENKRKPLVCKELRKIWEMNDPNMPWKKGDYDESNTLLLDDSPHKALLNPLHTAIFPHPYQYLDKNDDSLGPKGDLRVYLEGLLKSDNVQKYVEEHPFGQGPITEQNCSWEFYSRVIQQMSDKRSRDKTTMSNSWKDKTPSSMRTSS